MIKEKNISNTQLGGLLISRQISDLLYAEMRDGRYANVDRLPSELELAAECKVSRTVIRDALSELEREGYVERVRGIGTVIHHSVVRLTDRLDQKQEYNTLICHRGHCPHSDSVQVGREIAGPALAAALQISTGSELLRIRKRVLADAIPVIYSIDYLPIDTFSRPRLSRMDFSLPIFDLLEQYADIQVTSTVTNLQAVYGSPPIRQALRVTGDRALLLLHETSYDRLCRPVMYSDSYYTDFFDFSILRKKL